MLAFSILQNLNRQVTMFGEKLKDVEQKKIIDEWLTISMTLQFVLVTISIFSMYTLYRQF